MQIRPLRYARVANVQENITVTVEGVADVTAPTGEITVDWQSWRDFTENPTFSFFFTGAQDVTLSASDNTNCDVKIEYLVSNEKIARADLEGADFTEYENSFKLYPYKRYIVYARLTDEAGNVAYISSQGFVLENGGTQSPSSPSVPTSPTVKFDTGDGEIELKAGDDGKINEPATPSKDGYTFEGWYTDSTFTKKFDFNSKITGDTTLVAKWKKNEWVNPFTDVEEGAWYTEYIRYVSENSLMMGVSDTEFAPNEKLTRAMFVTVLWRMEGQPGVNYAMPFTDIDEESYYAEAVRWAASVGIINGVSATKFAPDTFITREQIAAIIFRYAEYKQTAPTGAWAIGLNYADAANISDYATEGVMYCLLHGIMLGKQDSLFDPQSFTTRAEVAAVIKRLAENGK